MADIDRFSSMVLPEKHEDTAYRKPRYSLPDLRHVDKNFRRTSLQGEYTNNLRLGITNL